MKIEMPSIKKIILPGILALSLYLIPSGSAVLGGGQIYKFTVGIGKFQNAIDAYRIKLVLSRMEGVETIQFIIEGSGFRGCCSISDEYNRYLKSLQMIKMAVVTRGVDPTKVIEFLRKEFHGHSFRLLGTQGEDRDP